MMLPKVEIAPYGVVAVKEVLQFFMPGKGWQVPNNPTPQFIARYTSRGATHFNVRVAAEHEHNGEKYEVFSEPDVSATELRPIVEWSEVNTSIPGVQIF